VNKTQKAVIASLIGTSAIAWIASIQQPDMMVAMTTYNPIAISLFTASWTAGMAAMMFPAITPMVLLYNTFVTNKENKGLSITIQEKSRPKSTSIRSLRVILFIGCYLLVWALTGVALLLGWSVIMNSTIMMPGNSQLLPSIYGSLLIIAGAYQFTPLKKMCVGYCESPMSFFMRRWKDGTFGAMRMGLWHGIYCLGCCWAYFLLMVALGWMNLLWMGLFAGIIFGEKMWSRGIWVARAAGAGLAVIGVLVIAGMLPSLVESSMSANNESMGMDAGMFSNIDSPMGYSDKDSMTPESHGDNIMTNSESDEMVS
jgi:predicted metal-binding membrane protein